LLVDDAVANGRLPEEVFFDAETDLPETDLPQTDSPESDIPEVDPQADPEADPEVDLEGDPEAEVESSSSEVKTSTSVDPATGSFPLDGTDHDYSESVGRLPEVMEEVVDYVAGFCARHAQRSLGCESCRHLLFDPEKKGELTCQFCVVVEELINLGLQVKFIVPCVPLSYFS
jgi:hypothetical protein